MKIIRLGLLIIGLGGCPSEPATPTHVVEGCATCHMGIEQAHPTTEDIGPSECTICHGGDPAALDQEGAHIPIPDDWAEIRGNGLPAAPEGFIGDFAPDQLDAIDPDYLRFINPGDLRTAEIACGECHPEQVATVKTSIMSTNAGHYWPTRSYADLQDATALYGTSDITVEECDPDAGTVCELTVLRPQDEATIEQALADDDLDALEQIAYDHYLAKSCNTCHAGGYPKNNSPHLYRSSGCSACHMVYNEDGVYEGNDPTVPVGVPVHASRHELTAAVPTTQCTTCHFQGGRIGLNFRGIREGGFSEAPPNAQVWAAGSAYGHVSGYYFVDEDTTNDVDETPPDLHHTAGMHCADCHVGTDVHGDGQLHSASKTQFDLRCEDCHGDARDAAEPDEEGIFRTEQGRPLPQLSQDDDGGVVLTSQVTGVVFEVPQPATILAGDEASDEMRAAMEPRESDGWSHPDSLTCDTCHNSWQLYCLGCHVTLDMRLNQVDYQTGTKTPGNVRGSRDIWMLDHLLLGKRTDGMIQATNPSQHVQLTVIDFEGEVRIGRDDGEAGSTGVFRSNATTDAQAGFAPFFQHTSSAEPRPCATCHPVDASADEQTRVKGTYGFGTGEFVLDNPDGEPVDPLQFLDADGNQTSAFAHPGTGPLDGDTIERALSVTVDPPEEDE